MDNIEPIIEEWSTQIDNLESAIKGRDTHINNLKNMVQDKDDTLNHIYGSNGWKSLSFYYNLRNRLLPPNSKLTLFAKTVYNIILNPMRIFGNLNKTKQKVEEISKLDTFETQHSVQDIQVSEGSDREFKKDIYSKKIELLAEISRMKTIRDSLRKQLEEVKEMRRTTEAARLSDEGLP